jgi:hypothetical protein
MADALLVIREGDDAGREVPLPGALVIGRGEDADLVLSDAGISRRHAQVTPEGVGAVIEDLGSSNGTFVNGEQVSDPRRLRDGDEIQLGGALLSFAGGTEETQLIEPTDPDATQAHPGPAAPAAAGAAAGAAAAAEPPAPPHEVEPEPVTPPPEADPPWDPIPMPKPRAEQPPPPPPPRREPAPEPQPAAAPASTGDAVNDWNLPALAAIVLGPLSIALLLLSSGSGFYAALPVAVTGVALGTIGRNKVDRGESTRYRSLASAGRTFSIVGTVLAAIILIAVIAINQFLDVSAESISELIDEVRSEIENR